MRIDSFTSVRFCINGNERVNQIPATSKIGVTIATSNSAAETRANVVPKADMWLPLLGSVTVPVNTV